MKKTLLLLTAATLLSGCRPTGFRYTLTGHIEGLNDSVALVESVTKDTLAVLPAPDGSFRYNGRYDEPFPPAPLPTTLSVRTCDSCTRRCMPTISKTTTRPTAPRCSTA